MTEQPMLYGIVQDLWAYEHYVSPSVYGIILDLFALITLDIPDDLDTAVWVYAEEDPDGDFILVETFSQHITLCELLCEATRKTGDCKYAHVASLLHSALKLYRRDRQENSLLN